MRRATLTISAMVCAIYADGLLAQAPEGGILVCGPAPVEKPLMWNVGSSPANAAFVIRHGTCRANNPSTYDRGQPDPDRQYPHFSLASMDHVASEDAKLRAEIAATAEAEVKNQLTPAIERKLEKKVTDRLAELTAQEVVTLLKDDYAKRIKALERAVAALQPRPATAQTPGAQ